MNNLYKLNPDALEAVIDVSGYKNMIDVISQMTKVPRQCVARVLFAFIDLAEEKEEEE